LQALAEGTTERQRFLNHIRGEKVVFGKEDICNLDAMPSAAHEDACVLATPKRKSWMKRFAKLLILLVLFAGTAIGALFIALEEGYLDETLTARAETSLSNALGKDFKPEVGSIRLRFSQNWMLAFAAVDVRITHVPTGVVALKTDSITAVLDPVSLVQGRMALARAEIGTAEGDLRFLPPRPPFDWKTLRIDSVPQLLAQFYPALDRGIAALEKANTQEIVAGNISLLLPPSAAAADQDAANDRVALGDLSFSRQKTGGYVLTSAVRFGKLNPKLTLSVDALDGRATAVNAELAGLAAEPFLLKYSKATGERRYGLDLPLDLAVTAERDRNLVFKLTAGEGLFYADGDPQAVKGGKALLSYDFKGKKVELSDGLIDLGDTVIPLEGAAVDLDQLDTSKPHGFAFEVIGNDAVAVAEGANEEPERFNASASGYFLTETRELQLDKLGVATAAGNLAGSLQVQFVKPSPAVNFAARADNLTVASVKQLWPYWFGKKARKWVLANMTEGTVKNGEIDISLAAGRIPDYPEPLVFRENELRISFDAEDTSVRFFETMPRSVKTSGHFVMQDRDIDIAIKDGQIPLPSGKFITGSNGTFEIADASKKPLMASLAIDAAGDASAVAEFASYKPIDAMTRAPFKAADLSGRVKGTIKATFGLDKAHRPPKPDWDVSLGLDNVALKEPFQDRKISNLDGKLVIDTQKAQLKGTADIDDMNFEVSLSEPLDKDRKADRKWAIEGKMSEGELLKVAPSLASYVSGGVGVNIGSDDEGSQKAKLNLTSTEISIPVIGWRKGPGVAATAEFTLSPKDGGADIRDLVFEGDGFGAKGNITLDRRGLVSAKFSRVKLANADNFALTIIRKSGGFNIDVSGESIDMRPFLERVKSNAGPPEATAKLSDTITATIGRASGYNKETLSSVILKASTDKGVLSTMNFSAVTRSGQAVVIKRDSAAGAIEVTAGDAGAVARFADFYRNMYGGLLNVSLKARDADSWRGSIDIRNFALVNEERLKSIVSARTGKDGRSLSDAVKADIDVSSQKFRRGFARILLDSGRMRIENGVVRGDQVGATFQGTVRDANNQTDLTGTFMPAYGINRLFGELPLIGAILGNGRDRGLVGITFKLAGPIENPRLTVNPLSLIAPGVFRNIFEFE
jgi:hypothetical protein